LRLLYIYPKKMRKSREEGSEEHWAVESTAKEIKGLSNKL